MSKNIKKLIEDKRYRDAANYAVYTEKTYEARELFSQDKNHNEEKFDSFEILLLADAQKDFDCYCQYIDYRQPLHRNFYLDRRKYLKEIVDTITNMYYPKDGKEEYDVVRIKLPTRTGKSEIFNRAPFWVQGNQPTGETLYCVGGGNLKDSIHAKRESFIDEYWERHLDVFPDASVVRMNKKDSSVWLSKKEYADIATVTVGGSIEGFVQCTNLLVLDDLVASNEINSVKRLEEIYESNILNAITRRMVGEPKVVLIGTPIPTQTGIKDPLDRYYDYLERGGSKCKEFVIPALNEDGESNIAYRKFESDGSFKWNESTDQIQREKKRAYSGGNEVEIVTFEVTRQMSPVNFGDRRFARVKTFTDLPDGRYRETTVYDPADTGSDSAVLVYARIYDNEPKTIYIVDVFMSKKPLDTRENGGHLDDLADFVIYNDIHHFYFENNLGGSVLGNTLKKIFDVRDWIITLDDFKQMKNKNERIRNTAAAILDSVRVRDIAHTKMYDEAMEEFRNWTERARHDDVPDVITKIVEIENDTIERPNSFMIPNDPIF